MYWLLLSLFGLIIFWVLWRFLSRKRLLPCPAFISWLVELENPLARVTRSESILKQLGTVIGARIADIGCGPGRVTLPLAQAVGAEGEVLAVDVQNEMLQKVARKAGERGLSNIKLLLGDARRIELLERSLDAVLLVMALGEIPEHPKVFLSIYSALNENGRLLISESVFDPHYTRKNKLIALATRTGFIEESCVGNGFAYTIVFKKKVNSNCSAANSNRYLQLRPIDL